MSDNVLVGLVVGLFIGGILGAMAMAVAATSSNQRLYRVVARRVETADPSEEAWAGSSMRVDLLVGPEEVPESTRSSVPGGDDLDQEMMDLVRRYGEQSES